MATDTLPKTDKNGKVREKVQLKPGFHLTDWLRLTQQSTIDLSGGESKLLLGAGKCLVGTLLSHGNRNMTSIVEEPSNLNDSSKDSLIKAKDLLVESLNELERDADALDQNINSLEINDNNS
eukprot:gene23238-30120_t